MRTKRRERTGNTGSGPAKSTDTTMSEADLRLRALAEEHSKAMAEGEQKMRSLGSSYKSAMDEATQRISNSHNQTFLMPLHDVDVDMIQVRQLRHDEAMAEARRQLKRYTKGHEGAMKKAQESMRETTRLHEQAMRDAQAKIAQLEHDKAMAEAAAKMQSLKQLDAG
ncbi:hypothetical protein PG984_006939 [Apiospora sp. TS-2023a]